MVIHLINCTCILFALFPVSSLFIPRLSVLFLSFLPRSPLTQSHPSHLSASHPLSHLDFAPGATVCTCVYIHPVAAATAGGHISGWMNKRPGDPHPQRWRERKREGKSNFIFFFRRGVWCVRKMRRWGGWRWGWGRVDSVGEMSS